MLLPDYLKLALKFKFSPNIVLYATQINRQFSNYVAYKPDPEAKLIDAFTKDWFSLKFYPFLLVSVIQRVLSKIKQHEAEDILVPCTMLVPCWPNHRFLYY